MLWHSLAQLGRAGLAVVKLPAHRSITRTKPKSKFLILIFGLLDSRLRQFTAQRRQGKAGIIAILLEARTVRAMRSNALSIGNVAIIEAIGAGIKRFNIPVSTD